MELAGQRERLDPADFSARAEARKSDLPVAATVIGLKHGDAGALRLLTIAAAISAGPLDSALQASRNQRQYERMLAERRLGQDVLGQAPNVVALDSPAVLNDQVAPPTVAEAQCAARQLAAWHGLS